MISRFTKILYNDYNFFFKGLCILQTGMHQIEIINIILFSNINVAEEQQFLETCSLLLLLVGFFLLFFYKSAAVQVLCCAVWVLCCAV